MSEIKLYTDMELLYSATGHCKCGAGLAYPLNHEEARQFAAWVCSRTLKEDLKAPAEHEAFPWMMYKIREETSINNHSGLSTRPRGTTALTVGHAKCSACGHEWESQPYRACGQSHHWLPGACPQCGNDCGAGLSLSSEDKRPRIESRFRTVVLEACRYCGNPTSSHAGGYCVAPPAPGYGTKQS